MPVRRESALVAAASSATIRTDSNVLVSSKSSVSVADTFADEPEKDLTQGSFNVVVRVRPMSKKELKKGYRSVIGVVDGRYVTLSPREVRDDSKPGNNRNKTFAFDNVFDEIRDNDWVFKKSASALVTRIFEGYNSTVFAYGATGAGKTHSMIGETEEPGLMFLVFQEIFGQRERYKESFFEFKISFVEIFNEEVRDLLVDKSPDLDLREDPSRGTIVHGVSYHEVEEIEEVMELLLDGNLRRKKDPARANATSARSHAILQVWVDRTQRSNIQHLDCGKFNLIDLAGSEKDVDTGKSRGRKREGANINRSLLSLSNCINALVDKRKFIPYRDSKLTRLLKDSLGGNSFTLMLACICPSSHQWDDTNNTLKYADRAKNIKVDPSVNKKLANLSAKDYAKIIGELKQQVNTLKEKLEDRVGDVSDVQKVGFGLTAKEREELLALKERAKELFLECHGKMAQLHKVEEQLLEEKIHKDELESKLKLTRQDEDMIEVLEAKMDSNRNVRKALKNDIQWIRRKFDPNGATWEIRSKTVFVLIERELEIALTTLSCLEFEFQNKKMSRTNDEIQRRVEILEKELTEKDEENKESVAENILLMKEVELIRETNRKLQEKNQMAEDRIRKAHAAHHDGGFWGAFGEKPSMNPRSPAMIAQRVKVPDKSLWERWDREEVNRWIQADEKMRPYARLFDEHDICGEDLIDITDHELYNMGVMALGHRKHFLREVSMLAGKEPRKYIMDTGDAYTDAGSDGGLTHQSSVSSRNSSIHPQNIGEKRLMQIDADDADERNPKTAIEYIAMYEPAKFNNLALAAVKGQVFGIDNPEEYEDGEKISFVNLGDRQDNLNMEDAEEIPHKAIKYSGGYAVSEAPSQTVDSEHARPIVSSEQATAIEEAMAMPAIVHFSDNETEYSDRLETMVEFSDDDLSIWTPRQVYSWLLSRDVKAAYARSFLDLNIDGKRLIDLVRSDLKAMNINQHGQRQKIYKIIQGLKHEHGIHEKLQEEIPDFPEVIENFNFLVLGPNQQIREQHMRLWISGYNKVQGNRVRWHMEVYPYGNNSSLGVRIGDLTSLSLLPDLLPKVSFVVLLFRFNQEPSADEEKYIQELEQVLSTEDVRKEFWKKTVIGLDGGLSFIPGGNPGNNHGLTQSIEHWHEFRHWRISELEKRLSWGFPSGFHIIEQDTKGSFSEDLVNNGEHPYNWPLIPDQNERRGKDWRSAFLLSVVKLQEYQDMKRLIIACALQSDHMMPKQLEALANRVLESKNQETGPAMRDDSSRIQRIQLLRERLDMLVAHATDGDVEEEEIEPAPPTEVPKKSPQVHFRLAAASPDIHPTLLGKPVFNGDPPPVALGGIVAASDYAPTLDLSDEDEPIQGNTMELALRQLDYQSSFQPNHSMIRLKERLDEEARASKQKESSMMQRFRQVARTPVRDDVSGVSSAYSTPSIIRKLHEVADNTYNVSESNDTRIVSQLNQRPHETFSGGLSHQLASSALRNLGHNAPSLASSTTASYHTDSTNVISLRGGKNFRRSIHVNDEDDEKMSSTEDSQPKARVTFKMDKDDAISVLTVPTAPISVISDAITDVVGATHKEVITEYIRRLTLIYRTHQPKMIQYIPTILKQNVGKEHEMYTKVCHMYKVPVEPEWVVINGPKTNSSPSSKNPSPSPSPRHNLPTFRNRARGPSASPQFHPPIQKPTQFIQTSRPTNGGLSLTAKPRFTQKIPSFK